MDYAMDYLKELLKKNCELIGVVPKAKNNDILVHCCVEDVEWVKEHLLAQLEGKLKRQCFLSYRDDKDLGKDVVDAINDDVDSAANILLVISQKYVSYSWHAYYVKMAHRRCIQDDIPLVVVFLDDVETIVFPEFCRIERCLIHHRLLQQCEGKLTDGNKKELSWKDVAGNYLNNKSFNKSKTSLVDRHTVVSVAIKERSEFIHTDITSCQLSKQPARSIRDSVESALFHDQIILENQASNGLEEQDLKKKVDENKTKPLEMNGGNIVQHRIQDFQQKIKTCTIPNSNTTRCCGEEEVDNEGSCCSHFINIRRKKTNGKKQDHSLKRIDEVHVSTVGNLAQVPSNAEEVPTRSAGHCEKVLPCDKEGNMAGSSNEDRVRCTSVVEDPLEKSSSGREMACDIDRLLQQFETEDICTQSSAPDNV